jgi:ligand-binding SRPBCC domain-containing protein
MSFHTLRREQWIPRPLQILTPGPIRLAAGTRLRYRLRWHGVPVTWTTEIRRWEPPFRFIDAQLTGPYRLWHHTHRFAAMNGGTRMTDIVRIGERFATAALAEPK